MECSSHHVSTKALRALILKTIQTVSRYALSNEMEFARKVREASALQQAQEVKEAKARIRKTQKRCKELDVLIQKLYESYALNKITEKRFDDFLAAYEQEQAELKTVLETDTGELQAYEADSDDPSRRARPSGCKGRPSQLYCRPGASPVSVHCHRRVHAAALSRRLP